MSKQGVGGLMWDLTETSRWDRHPQWTILSEYINWPLIPPACGCLRIPNAAWKCNSSNYHAEHATKTHTQSWIWVEMWKNSHRSTFALPFGGSASRCFNEIHTQAHTHTHVPTWLAKAPVPPPTAAHAPAFMCTAAIRTVHVVATLGDRWQGNFLFHQASNEEKNKQCIESPGSTICIIN